MPQPLTTVIHIRDMKQCDVRIDRKTIFGNPFRITGKRSRTGVLRMYRTYFYDRISHDIEFLDAVLELRGNRLACWCKPPEGFQGRLLCHGQILAAYLNREKASKDEKQPKFCANCGGELSATNTTSGLPTCPACFTSEVMTKEEGEIPKLLECEYDCGSTATKNGFYWDIKLSMNSGWSGCWKSGKVRGNPPFINVRKATFYCGCKGWE